MPFAVHGPSVRTEFFELGVDRCMCALFGKKGKEADCQQVACCMQGRQADCQCAIIHGAGRQPEAHLLCAQQPLRRRQARTQQEEGAQVSPFAALQHSYFLCSAASVSASATHVSQHHLLHTELQGRLKGSLQDTPMRAESICSWIGCLHDFCGVPHPAYDMSQEQEGQQGR